jgi:hypothetical protein
MNYKVRLAPAAKATIEGWRLPRAILIQILNVLYNDLPANLDNLLKNQVMPYADLFSHQFVGPPIPPSQVPTSIVFFVRRNKEKELLGVVQCNNLTSDPEAN